jgi:hypothetical protein
MESVDDIKVQRKVFVSSVCCLFFVRKKIISPIRVRKIDAKLHKGCDSPNAAVTGAREE